ncbi:MAG: DUF4253 domain-containing protein [Lachnospiraceae bacterium]|nr:DUF4253 domain-containing protein [Lachnospiraceae bacterium]
MWKYPNQGQTEYAESLMKYLDCPCEYFAPMKDDAPLMAAYEQARERGKAEGFLPMLLVAEEMYWESDSATMKAEREKMLSSPPESGEKLLERLLDERKEYVAEYGGDWEAEVIGEVAGGEPLTQFLGYWDPVCDRSTYPVVLAEVPVKNPWEIFAWLPFGGWNECPAPEEQMAAAKYWFEQYGAVPAVMAHDVLEFALPAPAGPDRAMKLALEQYAFCADIVDQGLNTVGRLADSLAASDKWFFWWD